jgi:hypothetical protein
MIVVMASIVPAIEPVVGGGEARSSTQSRGADHDEKSSSEDDDAGQL